MHLTGVGDEAKGAGGYQLGAFQRTFLSAFFFPGCLVCPLLEDARGMTVLGLDSLVWVLGSEAFVQLPFGPETPSRTDESETPYSQAQLP